MLGNLHETLEALTRERDRLDRQRDALISAEQALVQLITALAVPRMPWEQRTE